MHHMKCLFSTVGYTRKMSLHFRTLSKAMICTHAKWDEVVKANEMPHLGPNSLRPTEQGPSWCEIDQAILDLTYD